MSLHNTSSLMVAEYSDRDFFSEKLVCSRTRGSSLYGFAKVVWYQALSFLYEGLDANNRAAFVAQKIRQLFDVSRTTYDDTEVSCYYWAGDLVHDRLVFPHGMLTYKINQIRNELNLADLCDLKERVGIAFSTSNRNVEASSTIQYRFAVPHVGKYARVPQEEFVRVNFRRAKERDQNSWRELSHVAKEILAAAQKVSGQKGILSPQFSQVLNLTNYIKVVKEGRQQVIRNSVIHNTLADTAEMSVVRLTQHIERIFEKQNPIKSCLDQAENYLNPVSAS